jgi:hypothetical protein
VFFLGYRIRGAMFRRTLISRGICVASALALLVGVITAPIRPSRLAAAGHPSFLPGNVTAPPAHTTRVVATVVSARTERIKAVSSESEKDKELDKAASPTFLPINPSPPTPFSPAQSVTSSITSQALRPLRC